MKVILSIVFSFITCLVYSRPDSTGYARNSFELNIGMGTDFINRQNNPFGQGKATDFVDENQANNSVVLINQFKPFIGFDIRFNYLYRPFKNFGISAGAGYTMNGYSYTGVKELYYPAGFTQYFA